MSDEKHETVVAEMRIFKCRDLESGKLEICNAIANYFANRLEAAHKREVAIKDAVIQTESAARLAEQESHKREIAELKKQVANVAKLREALKSLMDNLRIHAMMPCEQTTMNRAEVCAMIEDCRAALAAPPRNCDMPLVVDWPADNNADKAWLVFKRHNADAYFDVSGLLRCIDWLLAPATEKEGGAK